MQIDKTVLDRLLALDDVTLAKTITALASGAGIDPGITESAVKNLRLVRASLSNATDKDIQNAAQMLGKERVSAIMEQLGERENGQ